MNKSSSFSQSKTTESMKFRESRLALLFDESTKLDLNLSIMKEKQNMMNSMIKKNEHMRAQSVKNFDQIREEKKKTEDQMKNIRIKSKLKKLDRTKLLRDVALKLIMCPYGEFTEIVCHWSRLHIEGWIPESREGSTLSLYNNRLYLIGGLSRNIMNQVLELPIFNPRWKAYTNFSFKLDPIFAHTTVTYEKMLLIFGGTIDYNELTRKRECLNIIRSLSPSTGQMNYLATHGAIYEFRKYHTSVIYCNHMLVYGGMNPKNSILDSCIVLNLIKLKWRNLNTIGPNPGPLAGHAACAVFFPEVSRSLFKKPKPIKNLKFQGIFIFGGCGVDNKPNNKVYVLIPGRRPLSWIMPVIVGQIPTPRYYHSMVWVEKINSLVVYGGRNDTEGVSYADIHVLRLEQLSWIRVVITGNPPIPRSSHCAVASEKKMYIFGGVSYGKYCSSELLVMDFDFPELYKKKSTLVLPKVM